MRALLILLTALLTACTTPTAQDVPRIAVISAFPAELALLEAQVVAPSKTTINGVEFMTGRLQGKPVVLFLSGVSMTNAAMTTQLALDRFRIDRIVFSGIAGGVNPGLKVGDVVVAQRWAQYLEMVAAREVAPGRHEPPPFIDNAKLPNFGMWHPRAVDVRSPKGAEKKLWFEVDPAMMQAASRAASVRLERCDAQKRCLSHDPRIVIGGNGVSGPAFVDNKALREYTFATFAASVLDMETAAVAHVAYANGVPFIAFRSLSDLAGGGDGENEIQTFFRLAADNSARVMLAFLDAL